MKTCSLCGTTYDDKVDFCFQDGTPLRKVEDGPPEPPREAATEPVATPRRRPDTQSGLDAPDPSSALDAPEAASSVAALDPAGLPEPKGPPADDDEPYSQVPEDDEPVVSPASEETGLAAPLVDGDREPLPDVDETGAEPEDEGLTAPLPGSDPAEEPEPPSEDAPFPSKGDEFSFGDAPVAGGDADFIPYAEQPSSSRMPLVLGAVAVVIVLGAGGFLLTQGGGEGEAEATPASEAPAEVAPEPRREPPPPPPEPVEEEPEPEEPEEEEDDAVADAEAAAEEEARAAEEEEAAARRAAAAEARRAEQRAQIAARRAAASEPEREPARRETRSTSATPGRRSGSDAVWQQPAAAAEGELNVTSEPAGATVFVDGTAVGTTPTSTTVAYGTHAVKIELDGYQASARSIEVKTGSLSVPFQLEPEQVAVATGRVNLFGTTGSVVYDGSTKLGTIPVTAQLAAGTHTFKVVLPDGSSYSVTRDVQFPEGGRPVNIPLSPN